MSGPSSSTQALRAIIYRISTSSPRQLAQSSPQIASSLAACKPLLAASPENVKSGDSTLAPLINRLRTTLTSLLQARELEARWAAVVLVKAVVDVGALEVLSKSGPAWVRSLLAILKRSPDPPTTRLLAASTLTRVFILTWPHPNLVRELTTPNLPAFISACLNNIAHARCSARERETVLATFCTLLPRHPTVFRAYEQQIRLLLLKILSATSSNSDEYYPEAQEAIAQRLFVLLHHCAPKQGAVDKWDETLKGTVAAAHATCDRVFRSLIETWTSRTGMTKAKSTSLFAGEPELESDADPDAIGLSNWKGIYCGSDRLITLLHLLRSHMEVATGGTVTLRVGLIIDLLVRLFSTTTSLQPNPEIAKDEPETLSLLLPSIHAAAMELVDTLLTRFGYALTSVAYELLELVTDVFNAEMTSVEIRRRTYDTIGLILDLIGPSMQKNDVAELSPVIKACSEDLLPSTRDNTQPIPPSSNVSISTKSQEQHSKLPPSGQHGSLKTSSSSLLSKLLRKINPTAMPRKIRIQLERTAVLAQHREALVACVMSPSTHEHTNALQPSLIPLLSRMYPGVDEAEFLLRPRMPPLRTQQKLEDPESDGSIEDNEEINGLEQGSEDTNGLPDAPNRRSDAVAGHPELDRRAEEEELYTSTPPAQPSNLHASIPALSDSPSIQQASTAGASKRRAVSPPRQDMQAEVSAKRLRASPVAETIAPLISEPAAVTPGLGTVALPQNGQLGLPAESLRIDDFRNASSTAGGVQQNGSDDEGSDFEIPELNMEPDTDDEEGDGGDG